MTLDQLFAFEAVVKSGSFRKAAEVLHISQPAVSTSIKKLEDEFEILLFSREGYRPEMTSEGKVFYEKTKPILEQTRSLDKLGHQLAKGEPEIKIAINLICPMPSVFSLLKRFFDQYPNTQLTLSFESLGGAIERLFEEDVDLALTSLPSTTKDDLETNYVTKVNIIPVCASKYLRSEKNEILTQKMLRQSTQVILADTSHTEQQSTGILRDVTKLTVNDLSVKKELILSGLGWGGLPEHLVKEEINAGTLEEINLEEVKRRTLMVHAIRKKHRHMGPIATKLWNYVCELDW
jgi:DNA-binding transcriptional LysR family regulator